MAREVGGQCDGCRIFRGKGNARMEGEVTLEDCERLTAGTAICDVDAGAGTAALICWSSGLKEGFQ